MGNFSIFDVIPSGKSAILTIVSLTALYVAHATPRTIFQCLLAFPHTAQVQQGVCVWTMLHFLDVFLISKST